MSSHIATARPAGAPYPAPGGAPEPVLELLTVIKVYPGRPPVPALRDVTLTVTAGELVAVLGPSGSGKTTLLHLAGTLDLPTTGTVKVTGLDVAALGDRQLAGLRAAAIGFVFQQFFLAEHQTVLDNVADGRGELQPCDLATLESRPWPAPCASPCAPSPPSRTGASLRALMTGLLGAPYGMTQASYDLARLRRNGLITRRPHASTYDLTADGLAFALGGLHRQRQPPDALVQVLGPSGGGEAEPDE